MYHQCQLCSSTGDEYNFFSFKNCGKVHVTLKLTILTNFECMDPWHEVLIHLHCCTGCVILSGEWTREGVGVLLWVRVSAPCCLHLWAQHIADVSRVLHRDSGDHCLVVFFISLASFAQSFWTLWTWEMKAWVQIHFVDIICWNVSNSIAERTVWKTYAPPSEVHDSGLPGNVDKDWRRTRWFYCIPWDRQGQKFKGWLPWCLRQ